MFQIILGVHLILCVFLMLLVLLQQGKGADMGAAFGGSSQSLFGASGAGNILSRATTVLAILFMITSILLVRHYQDFALTSAGVGTSSSEVLEGSVLEKAVQAPAALVEEPANVPAPAPAEALPETGAAESK